MARPQLDLPPVLTELLACARPGCTEHRAPVTWLWNGQQQLVAVLYVVPITELFDGEPATPRGAA